MTPLPHLLLAAFLLLGLQSSQAQEPEPMLHFGDQTAVAWVMAPTVVTGGWNPRTALTSADFRLEVDGQTVEIKSFDASQEHTTTLLLLQDLSGSMANGGKLEASRQILHRHLAAARPGDEMTLVTFASNSIQVEVPATTDLEQLAAHTATWRAYGTTALHDAISWIPKLRLAPASTPAVLLITDGIDNASVLDAEAARAIAQRAEIPVYVLALRGSRLDQPRPDVARNRAPNAGKVRPVDEFLPYAKLLQHLAASTGGRYFDISHSDDIEVACSAIRHELRSRYTLGFQLSSRGEETYHDLRITVPGHHVSLRHRAGYLGSAPH